MEIDDKTVAALRRALVTDYDLVIDLVRNLVGCRVCKHCGAEIEKVDGVGWVEMLGNPDDGHYVDCPARRRDKRGNSVPVGKHAPKPKRA